VVVAIPPGPAVPKESEKEGTRGGSGEKKTINGKVVLLIAMEMVFGRRKSL